MTVWFLPQKSPDRGLSDEPLGRPNSLISLQECGGLHSISRLASKSSTLSTSNRELASKPHIRREPENHALEQALGFVQAVGL